MYEIYDIVFLTNESEVVYKRNKTLNGVLKTIKTKKFKESWEQFKKDNPDEEIRIEIWNETFLDKEMYCQEDFSQYDVIESENEFKIKR